MSFTLGQTLMVMLILACVCMGILFIAFHRRGNTFVAAFDRAAIWGGGVFLAGSCLSTAAHIV